MRDLAAPRCAVASWRSPSWPSWCRPGRLLRLGGREPAHGHRRLHRRRATWPTGPRCRWPTCPVGSVRSIALDGDKAKVTLAFDNGVRIPADVSAAIDRTTILGDQFVELTVPRARRAPRPPPRRSWPTAPASPTPRSSPTSSSSSRPGRRSSAPSRPRELEQIIEAGGEGFTGQEASLKAFLADLSTVANGYAQHTSDITQAVERARTASPPRSPRPAAPAPPRSTNLAQTVAILAKNSSQFETLLQSLDNLSSQGRSILENYYPQIVTQLQTLQAVSSQLAQHQADLAGLLSEIPAADNALPQAVRNGYVQLYENIIVCGIPGLGRGRQLARLHLRAAFARGAAPSDQPPPHRQPDRVLRGELRPRRLRRREPPRATRCRARRC